MTTNNNSNNEVEQKKTVMKALFDKYEAADNKVIEAQKTLEEAFSNRSDIVQEMGKVVGQKNKVLYKGKEVIIVNRFNKTTEKDNWFLRGANQKKETKEVISID